MDLAKFYILHSDTVTTKSHGVELHWKTCLRNIYFGYKSFASDQVNISSGIEVYESVEAYKFLLQVVCGLKSPMIGETEVFGQFKNYIDSLTGLNSAGESIKQVLIDIRNTSKKIRSEHLINLGAQSYGSLLRKQINFNNEIHIVGAGQFVEDIIPWLSKKSDQIYIHSRNVEKSKSKKQLSILKNFSLDSSFLKSGTLIIAAPLSSKQMSDWVGSSNFDVIYDLRGSSSEDPLNLKSEIFNLKQFFDQIENNKSKIEKKVSQANVMIQLILDSKLKGQKLHPFGWDDICA